MKWFHALFWLEQWNGSVHCLVRGMAWNASSTCPRTKIMPLPQPLPACVSAARPARSLHHHPTPRPTGHTQPKRRGVICSSFFLFSFLSLVSPLYFLLVLLLSSTSSSEFMSELTGPLLIALETFAHHGARHRWTRIARLTRFCKIEYKANIWLEGWLRPYARETNTTYLMVFRIENHREDFGTGLLKMVLVEATYQVQINFSVQTMKTSIWIIRSTSRRYDWLINFTIWTRSWIG